MKGFEEYTKYTLDVDDYHITLEPYETEGLFTLEIVDKDQNKFTLRLTEQSLDDWLYLINSAKSKAVGLD